MPQNPLAATIAKTPAGAQATGRFDVGGNLMVSTGGLLTMLNITAPTLIKVGAGRVGRILVSFSAIPTGGALTLNDVATIGGAAAANQLISFEGSLLNSSGVQSLTIDFAYFNGLVISALPTGATNLQLAVSYS